MIPQDILFDENNRLHEIIADFKRHRFGKRSERHVSAEQLVFDEAEAIASQAKAEESESALDAEVEVPAHKRKRGQAHL